MKRVLSMLLIAALLLAAAGVSLAESAAAPADAAATQAPAADGSTLTGRITAVDATTVTLSLMGGMRQPQGDNGQSAGGQPDGDAQQGGAQPSGTPPQDGSGQPNDSGTAGDGKAGGGQQGGGTQQGGGQPGGTPAQGENGAASPAEAQTVTITVTDDTVITSQETQAALALTDLTVDMMVTVTVSGDEAGGYTALTITVQPSQTAPAATDDGSAA